MLEEDVLEKEKVFEGEEVLEEDVVREGLYLPNVSDWLQGGRSKQASHSEWNEPLQ